MSYVLIWKLCNFDISQLHIGTLNYDKRSVRWWLRLAMIVYSALMVIQELIQIYSKVESKKEEEKNRWTKALKLYLRNTTNYMDWFIIVTVFAFAYLLEVNDGNDYQRVPWMENLMQIVILISWFRLFTDLIECLPISGYKQNLDMFYYLIKVYLKILLCFAPFFIAFSVIFKGVSSFWWWGEGCLGLFKSHCFLFSDGYEG